MGLMVGTVTRGAYMSTRCATVTHMSNTRHTQASKGARQAARDSYVAALRDGRRQRASTYDHKSKARRNKYAARGRSVR